MTDKNKLPDLPDGCIIALTAILAILLTYQLLLHYFGNDAVNNMIIRFVLCFLAVVGIVSVRSKKEPTDEE